MPKVASSCLIVHGEATVLIVLLLIRSGGPFTSPLGDELKGIKVARKSCAEICVLISSVYAGMWPWHKGYTFCLLSAVCSRALYSFQPKSSIMGQSLDPQQLDVVWTYANRMMR